MSEGSRLELEDVFDALVASEESPEPAVVERWVRDYPQFEHELVDFMASWTLMKSAALVGAHAGSDAEAWAEAKDDNALVLRGMSIVQNLLHEMSQPPKAPRQVAGLLDAAKAAGMNLRDVARATHLGETVLRKLDRRLIRFASIPREAIAAIAEALRCRADDLSEYLQQPPTLAAGAHYCASRTPQLAEPEDFILAVRRDPTMSTKDRWRWLGATGDRRV